VGFAFEFCHGPCDGEGAGGELLRAGSSASARIKSAALAALQYKRSAAAQHGGAAAAGAGGEQQQAAAQPAQPQVAVVGVVERTQFDAYTRPKRTFFHNDPEDPDSGAMLVAP
jgi:hypothetical protein